MFTRREDGHLRVPSPAVTRRHFRSRETQSTAYDDNHFLDPRLRSRDPSPGGIGRLSTSAPPGGDSSLFHRRYRDQRGLDHTDYAGPSYITSTAARTATSAKDTNPRRSRTTASSTRMVNGDAWTQPNRSRPRSFPEQQGTYLSDFASPRGYRTRSSSQGRDLTPDSYSGRNVGSRFESEYRRSQGSYYYDPVSPPKNSEVVTVVRDGEGDHKMGLGTEMVDEGSFTCDDGYTWHSTLTCLTCYLCAQLFRRPRILPCGHTFCSECLAQLKDESLREGRRIPGGHSSCAWEGRQKADVGVQFVCPMPECRYSMRLINLSKWSTRNKTVAETVDAVRRIYENRQDACTQTDITMESVLVTIPRSFVQDTPSPNRGEHGILVRRNSSTSLMDRVVTRALSMDSLSRSYIPQQHSTWRSYAAMLGMHILQQVLHT